MRIIKYLLLRLLQLSVQPAVLLFLDEQGDDVAVVEAEECLVVARRVGKDGPNSGLPAHVQTGRLGCRPGQADLPKAALVWRITKTGQRCDNISYLSKRTLFKAVVWEIFVTVWMKRDWVMHLVNEGA